MGKKTKGGGERASIARVSEALVQMFSSEPEKNFTLKQIFKLLHLDKHPKKMIAMQVLEEMEWDDYISRTAAGSFKLNRKEQVQTGTFIRRGNGRNSFQPDEGGKPVLVTERNSMFALNGDKVKVAYLARKRNHTREAIVTEIIERACEQFAGTLRVEKDIAFLKVDGSTIIHDILIPKSKLKKGVTGDKAVVRITEWPTEDRYHVKGEVIDILGKQGENNAEMHAILVKYNLPYKYPAAVEKAANEIPAEITQEEIDRREDFRETTTFTIDPHDAKDFDDALSIKKLKDNLWEVGVHIADVSHYVKEGSIIDREAQKRATSVYLVDRTIPMLPERLSNFICSLRPDEEKLTYSCVFNMNEKGEVKKWRLVHTVIKSDRRFCYEEVQTKIDAEKFNRKLAYKKANGKDPQQIEDYYPYNEVLNEEFCGKENDFRWECLVLDFLAKKLREKRFKNGAVKFDREELRFDIDEDGKPVRCYYKKSLDANQLIEEFMLLANRTVAEMIGAEHKDQDRDSGTKQKTKAKTLPYRIHDSPDPEKLEILSSFIRRFGYKMKSGGTKGETSRAFNNLMDDVNGKPEQKLIETLALRAMMKAKYSVHNIGHYGLAFQYYTHFTSPIRRYPDTMVHRLMTRYQEGGRSANENKYEDLCEHSSTMEQIAAQAERDSIKYKMVEFMAEYVGEEYDAHISGITSHGLYCEIDENHCEGFISVHDLEGDYYEFDERNYCMVGRRRHNRYQLGDPIRIRVARADVDQRQLDFVEAEE
ncbi:MAG: ribonuclease R [Bacteroidaceae bacterium]|nr:ribonuclease R [Bacteroidaceae bacterium]